MPDVEILDDRLLYALGIIIGFVLGILFAWLARRSKRDDGQPEG